MVHVMETYIPMLFLLNEKFYGKKKTQSHTIEDSFFFSRTAAKQ